MRRTSAVVVAACLVIAGLTTILVAPASAAPPLRGQIVDAMTGRAVANVLVRLHPLGSGERPVR